MNMSKSNNFNNYDYFYFVNKKIATMKTLLSSSCIDYDEVVVSIHQIIELYLKGLLSSEQDLELETRKLTTLARHLEFNHPKLKSISGDLSLLQDLYFSRSGPGDDYYETTSEECDNSLVTMKKVIEIGKIR